MQQTNEHEKQRNSAVEGAGKCNNVYKVWDVCALTCGKSCVELCYVAL